MIVVHDTLSATRIHTRPGYGGTGAVDPPTPAQVAVLRLTGPLRLAGVPMLRRAVAAALRGPPLTLVIDVAGLVAADEMGLVVFAEVTDTAGRAGVRLVLAAPTPILRERLRQLGARNLEISETVVAGSALADRDEGLTDPPLPMQRQTSTTASTAGGRDSRAWSSASRPNHPRHPNRSHRPPPPAEGHVQTIERTDQVLKLGR